MVVMDTDRLIRLNMNICGSVQRVGYRHLVQGIARKNRVTGFIKNLDGYDVLVIAEGRTEDVARFREEIRIQEYPVSVESIAITEEPWTGEFSYFEVVRGSPEEELAERFDSAISILVRMERKQDSALDVQKGMRTLQKETLDEVKGVRLDLNKTLTQEISEMRAEMKEIRAALIQAGIMHCA